MPSSNNKKRKWPNVTPSGGSTPPGGVKDEMVRTEEEELVKFIQPTMPSVKVEVVVKVEGCEKARTSSVVARTEVDSEPTNVANEEDSSEEEDDKICFHCGSNPCEAPSLWADHLKVKTDDMADWKMSNKQMRFFCYREYVRHTYGVVGRNNRIKVPTCLESIIRKQFPCGSNEEYTGFSAGQP